MDKIWNVYVRVRSNYVTEDSKCVGGRRMDGRTIQIKEEIERMPSGWYYKQDVLYLFQVIEQLEKDLTLYKDLAESCECNN